MEHADAALKKNVLGIVRTLDDFLNNTSLILLFEARGKKLLFPGDAQVENWQWALSQDDIRELLHDVDVYKVGHHGSRGGTPRKLWSLFDHRKGRKLTTLLSTAAGVYERSGGRQSALSQSLEGAQAGEQPEEHGEVEEDQQANRNRNRVMFKRRRER